MKLHELLAGDGILTPSDLDVKRGNKSRYDYLRDAYGEINADRIIRNLEVRSWFRDWGMSQDAA
jgi:hypothetical protein